MDREIILACGSKTQVDDQDFVYLSGFNWNKHSAGYAETRDSNSHILMHQVIALRMGLTGMIDHKNEDKLDNRRENIRETNHSLNGANRGKQSNNTTGYKGVFDLGKGRYKAQIRVKGKSINLGHYSCKKQAAVAYNLAAVKYFGEHAKLNEV